MDKKTVNCRSVHSRLATFICEGCAKCENYDDFLQAYEECCYTKLANQQLYLEKFQSILGEKEVEILNLKEDLKKADIEITNLNKDIYDLEREIALGQAPTYYDERNKNLDW